MTDVHILPVGTSLLRHLKTRTIPVRVANLLADHDGALRDRLLDVRGTHERLNLARLADDDPDTAAELLAELARLLDDTLSAELNSLDKLRSTRTGQGTGDIHVLVATDTDDGLRAGALLGQVLATRAETTLRYLDDPSTAGNPPLLANGQVVLVRIPRLDLDPRRDNSPDEHTWRALGDLGRTIARLLRDGSRDWHAEFHLTGGYKALMPYLLTVATLVSTVLRELKLNATVGANVLHEDSEQPVHLPIRPLTGRALFEVRRLTLAVGDTNTLNTDTVDTDTHDGLKGSYLRDDRPRELTETGIITVRVLRELGATP